LAAAAIVVGAGWQSDAVSTMACFHKGDFVAVEGFVSFSFWGVLSGHSQKVWSLKAEAAFEVGVSFERLATDMGEGD